MELLSLKGSCVQYPVSIIVSKVSEVPGCDVTAYVSNRHRHHRRSRVPPHPHSHTRVRAHARHACAQARSHVWRPPVSSHPQRSRAHTRALAPGRPSHPAHLLPALPVGVPGSQRIRTAPPPDQHADRLVVSGRAYPGPNRRPPGTDPPLQRPSAAPGPPTGSPKVLGDPARVLHARLRHACNAGCTKTQSLMKAMWK